MATYEYDEAGVMAAYFLITFLALILVPVTFSAATKKSEKPPDHCKCNSCVQQRKRVTQREGGLFFLPNFSKKTYFLTLGWSLFAFVCYKVSHAKVDSKIYDPFDILGISSDTPEKEIKSHFKKLSRMYHPDKVRATANLTLEAIQDRFVTLTKAYKALTDETIRENWIKYNNPDGPQRMSMGIALPVWVIEGKNNIWVLGCYAVIFGGALPAFVGRWWFGSRQKTKDGVQTRSAADFFKSLKEESTINDILVILSGAYQWELPGKVEISSALTKLEKDIDEAGDLRWTEAKKAVKDKSKQKKALILLQAHLLRIEVKDAGLQKEQNKILLQAPSLLNALLVTSLSRNWLLPSLAIMRLHAHLTQAVPLDAPQRLRLTQLPGIQKSDVDAVSSKITDINDFISEIEKKGDNRTAEMKKALEKWGRIEIVDAAFKVIGERVVSPSAITHLHIKLRLLPPGTKIERKELSVDETKRLAKLNETKDEKFLLGKSEVEELPSDEIAFGTAHAPQWPMERKPSWWIVLADDKSNRVVVPPFKVMDVPYARADVDRDYRSYKIQFQGPPNTGVFTWKIYAISDTFVGEDTSRDITLKIEEPTAPETQPSEDDISDPEEDSLAGQMAAMRGGPVKKRTQESDDESSTDDDQASGDSSDSDSD